MARISTVTRIVGELTALDLPRRVLPNVTDSATGVLKPYVAATAALSSTKWNVARAYLAVFGRAPDAAGLAFWAARPAAATVAGAVDDMVAAVAGSYVLDTDPHVMAALLYNHYLSKTEVEDPGGIAYWAGQITANGLGWVTEQIIAICNAASGFGADAYRNRMLVLESICRLQDDTGDDLDGDDSKAAVLRVDGYLATYEAAMTDVHRLLVLGDPSPTSGWARTWTASQLWDVSRLPDNASVRQVRSSVWWNRAGRMMRATIYLPPDFTSGTHRAIILWHGGGWRLGWPERLEWLANALASDTEQSYVVIAPSYRLTPFGAQSPDLEQDAEDILALVKASTSMLRCDGTKVGLMGESSGGHLACWLGATQDCWRVMAMYPPLDLRDTPPVSAGLEPYVDYYAPDTGTIRQDASPTYRWSSARSTKFNLWHGTGDGFVPAAQSQAFDTLVGANSDLTLLAGEGHGFSTGARASFAAAARAYFALS